MNNQKTLAPTLSPTSYKDATGTIDYGITNDYMFRALLQKNNRVLKRLICSLLHLNPKEVSSIVITNPIELDGPIPELFVPLL